MPPNMTIDIQRAPTNVKSANVPLKTAAKIMEHLNIACAFLYSCRATLAAVSFDTATGTALVARMTRIWYTSKANP